MKMLFAVLLTLLVTGCQAKPAQDDVQDWARTVSHELYSKIDKSQFAGKVCTIRLSVEPFGQPLSVQSEGGDPALCEAAIGAVRTSTFPPVPEELQKQSSVLLDFKI